MGYEQKGDYDAAIRDYTRGVEVEPECAEADQGRALTHYGKRENDKAWADVKECQRLEQFTFLCSDDSRGGQSCPPRVGGFVRGGQDCPPRKVLQPIVNCSRGAGSSAVPRRPPQGVGAR